MSDEQTGQAVDIRALLQQAIARFEHVLPGQAALGDFVHHNTLHGFQHLPFPQALAAAHRITGARGYLPQAQFRDCYRAGRVDRRDLEQVLNADPELEADAALFNVEGKTLTRRDVMLAALLHPLQAVTGSQFGWEMEERNALAACQGDVEEAARSRLLEAARRHGHSDEAAAVGDLWNACLQVLHLEHYLMHPEELQDISPERAEQMLAQVLSEEDRGQSGDLLMDRLIDREARSLMDALFERLGHELTLATLLRAVTGEDLMETMQPLLVRHVGSFLDQGLAAWHAPDRQRGFYAVWRDTAMHDPAWMLDDLPDWRDSLDALPDDPLDVILVELRWLGLDQARWVPYLERLALELPGWSGMFLWRHGHPGYAGLDRVRVNMADYLAVRLVLERLFAQRLCREQWMIEASFDILRWYFRHNHAEFLVRYSLYNLDLPEYLVALAQGPLNCSELCAYDPAQWQHLAHMIRTWRHSTAADRATGFSVHDHAWRLFRLAQHLGLCGAHIRALNLASVKQIFECMDNLDPQRAGFLWLQAYERHYREQLFSALAENHGRGRWSTRDQ
ncbi:MAG: Na-translocating system protein MpsB, partial [Thiogranum sp.]